VVRLRLFAIVGLVATALLAPEIGRGTSYYSFPLEDYVGDAAFIGVVRIESAELVTAHTREADVPCGAIYTVSVLDAIVGVRDTLRFFGRDSLGVGRRYVVFAANQESVDYSSPSSSQFAPQAIVYQQGLEGDEIEAGSARCMEDWNGLELVDEMTSPLLGYTLKGDQRDDWIQWVAKPGCGLPESVDQFTMSAKSLYVNGDSLSTREYFNKLDGDSAYPWLPEAVGMYEVVEWASYRAAILGFLKK
jgi:hypothetical protein